MGGVVRTRQSHRSPNTDTDNPPMLGAVQRPDARDLVRRLFVGGGILGRFALLGRLAAD
jgi:hypothetical protein